MAIPKYKLSRLYIYSSTASLFILLGHYIQKFLKYYDGNLTDHFNLYGFTVFLASIILLMVLLVKFKTKNKAAFLLLFFILASSAIFSYNFINPSVCADCKSNIVVAKRFHEQGLASFLKNYNKPTLYKIKKSPELYNKFLDYDDKLGFNYVKLLHNIENESPDITLSDDRKGSNVIRIMTGNYSPLLFCVLGLLDIFTGESYFSQIIIPANSLALLCLFSLYYFLGLFYKKEEYRDKLSILFIIMLLPIFFHQATQSTSVLMLAALVIWMLFFLLKNTGKEVNYKDLAAGLLYSIAVLSKFTALTLMLPITVFYLIRFKTRAIPKFIVFLLSFAAFPSLLYAIFEYDMILNIINGTVAEFSLISSRGKSISASLWLILHDPYIFGVPFILLLIIHMPKIRKYINQNESLITYMFFSIFPLLFYMFWRSWISRHWLGFIVLLIPLFVHIYNNCAEKNKMILSTSIFLLISNILILVNDGIVMAGYYQEKFQIQYWNY